MIKMFAGTISSFNFSERLNFLYSVGIVVLSTMVESATLFLLVPYVGLVSQSAETIESIERILSFWGIALDQGSLVIYFSVFYIALILFRATLQLYANYLITRFPYQYYQTRTKQLFEGYLHQNYLDFVDSDTNILLNHCSQTSMYATQGVYQLLQLFSYSLITIFIFLVLLFQDFLNSLGIIMLFALLGHLIYRSSKEAIRKMGDQLVELSKSSYQLISGSLRSFKEIRLYKKEYFFSERLGDILSPLADSYRKSNLYALIPNILTESVAIIILILIVLFLYSQNGLNSQFLAKLILFAAAGRRVLPSINQIISLGMHIQHRAESMEVFQNEIARLPKKRGEASRHFCSFQNKIDFRQVDFSYEGKSRVLEGVSFEVAKHSSVAFVGPSGGGKSTIADLLTGLLEPTGGRILVDGCEVENMMPLQGRIGYVPQSIFLLNDTIAANIAFGEDKADKEKLAETIQICHLKEFIESLPDGVNTVVGDQGVKLSGGQRQRIGIARALYQQPEIVIFDEATASLDTLSEMVITESIREMMGQKTVVAIAHRLSTIKNFDRIYVLDQGRIVASGKHEELLRCSELYSSMVEKPCAV
jgi:ATP-binding cassette, subfamily B, bacterial PglK